MDTKKIIFIAFILLATSAKQAWAETVADPKSTSQVTLAVDKYSENIPQKTLDEWVSHKIGLEIFPSYRAEIENTSFCPVDKIFCELILTAKSKQQMRLKSTSQINETAIKSYVEDLARKVNRDPQDAKFTIENGKVAAFGEAQSGIALNVEKSIATITKALENTSSQTIALPFDSKKSNLDYGDVNNLGIASLIGEGVSNFKGSPVNRVHNVKVGADRFNGILIKPGEEFSFVSVLGEVDAEHGYLPELVIKNNVTEPEFGGGICQVSTTAFRAAIYSGLKITTRKNHAYPVSYYNPQGMDSTVYIPRPDLRFVNNTPGYILIQTKIVGTILTFDFYGTDDGRKTTVDGPTILERQPDGSMKTTFSQLVVDKNGNQLIKDVFNSSYNSPYKYPHPGGPVLSAKPANWSNDEWKAYQQTMKDIAKAGAKKH